MSTKEKFVLKWERFSETMTSSLQEMRKDDDLFDITLIIGRRQLHAHRLILSACSPVLWAIVREIKSTHPYIYLKGVRYDILSSILDFMYQGEVDVSQDDLTSFLDLAEELQVKGLTLDPLQSRDSDAKGTCESSIKLYGRNLKKRTRSEELKTGPNRTKPTSKRRPHTRKKEVDAEVISDDEDVSDTVTNNLNSQHPRDATSLPDQPAASFKAEDDPEVKSECYSDGSEEIKSEISITDNLTNERMRFTVENRCDGSRKNLTNNANAVSNNTRGSSEDRIATDDSELLATLSEAMDDLTRDHMKQVPDKNWKCLECNQLFYVKLSCQNHIEAEHLNGEEGHVCPICSQKFPRIKAVREHVLSGHRKAGQPLATSRPHSTTLHQESDFLVENSSSRTTATSRRTQPPPTAVSPLQNRKEELVVIDEDIPVINL